MAETLRRASEADRLLVLRTRGRADATDAEVAEVLAVCDRSGGRAAVEARLRSLVETATLALTGATLADPAKSWLLGAALALTARDR